MTLAETFAQYPDTDKDTIHSYAEVYEQLFAPIRNRVRDILEIGVRGGGSLLAWSDWFPKANVYGIDNGSEAGMWTPPTHRNIELFHADQLQPHTLRAVGERRGPFDIIIDDGCHAPLVNAMTWAALFPYVRTMGGLYVIEDVEGITHAEALRALVGGTIYDRRLVKSRHDDILHVWQR